MMNKIESFLFGFLYKILIIFVLYIGQVQLKPLLFFWKIFKSRRKLNSVNNNELKKTPAHLALSIDYAAYLKCSDKEIDDRALKYFEKVAEIIYWALLYDIKCVSIYDPAGILKSNSRLLYKYLKKELKDCTFETGGHTICLRKKGINHQNGYENRNLVVFIRCPEDGKGAVLRAVKDIYLTEPTPRTILTEQIFGQHLNKILYPNLVTTKVNETMQASQLVTDPDLLMISGYKSLMGFLPWNIKNTEIHLQPSLTDLGFEEFEMSLRKFASCEQRFGK